ncbi:uncharacterized protein [Epargyreus clarus]|uniref:uncharacterized protein n=1 Tax=Epargyreus clarus TaxID=520877 RepID=UPI003C2D0B2B
MLLPPNITFHEKIAQSAVTIALHNFHWHHATLVLFNTLLCSVDIFLRSYKKNVFVGHGLFYPSFVARTRQYVLFGADITDIVHMLTWMQRHQFDNTGRYIIVCQSERNNCNETDAVNILWNHNIINVVVINYDRKHDKLNGFTYFHPEDCHNPRPSTLKNWESCLMNVPRKCRGVYVPKLKNLHGCPIVVSTFKQVPYMNITSDGIPIGADGDLLRIIAEKMNFNLRMMTPRIGFGWGKLEENGTWTGSLADVYHGWANFSMTSASITMSRYATFQMSIDYTIVTVAWVTHPSEIQSASLKLLRPLQANVRIALCISFIIVVVIRMFLTSELLSSLRRELNVTIPDGVIFHAWALCMGLPVGSFPTNKALLCLSIFWIWYCFLIRTLYQVYLINSLKTDVYTPEFDTLEEAIESSYPLGGGLALRDYYIDNALVYDGWVNVESNEIYPKMVKLSQGLKFVLAMNLDTAKMFLIRNSDKSLHILPQVIARSPTVLFYKKYSPLDTSLSIILTRLRESGIIQYIYLNNTGKNVFEDSTDTDIPISMGHYTGCYAILLTGWLLSTICFIIEQLMPTKPFEFYN